MSQGVKDVDKKIHDIQENGQVMKSSAATLLDLAKDLRKSLTKFNLK